MQLSKFNKGFFILKNIQLSKTLRFGELKKVVKWRVENLHLTPKYLTFHIILDQNKNWSITISYKTLSYLLPSKP